jgi:hypothetical protein
MRGCSRNWYFAATLLSTFSEPGIAPTDSAASGWVSAINRVPPLAAEVLTLVLRAPPPLFPVLAIKVLQALILRVSLCTLGIFLGPDNGLEFNLLR